MAQQRTGSSGSLWGVLFGAILVVLLVVNRLSIHALTRFAISHGHAGLAFPVVSEGIFALIALALYFFAGFLAARQTHRVESGIRAGLIAGVIVGIVALILVIFSATAGQHAMEQAVRSLGFAAHQRGPGVTIVRGIIAVLSVLGMVLMGTGMGALGALAGRGKRNLPTDTVPPAAAPLVPAAVTAAQPPSAYPSAGDYTPPAFSPNDTPTLPSNGPQE